MGAFAPLIQPSIALNLSLRKLIYLVVVTAKKLDVS